MNTDLLSKLTQAPGIPSREDVIRDVVVAELGPLMDDLRCDALGNVIGRRAGGGGPTVAIAAHMDEIGFLVRHINDQGFIRIQQVGGFDPRVLVAQRVTVYTRAGDRLPGVLQPGVKPIHLLQPGESKDLKLEDLFVDLGLPVDDVTANVSLGDMVTLDRELATIGNTVVSKALDDRLGLYVMLEAIRAAESTEATIVAVATTQEEVGCRGAAVAAFDIEPDIVVALDVTIAGDIPGNQPDAAVTRLGEGTAIKVFDSSHLPHPKLVEHLREIAERDGIPHQLELLPRGGTDASTMQRSRTGAVAGTISVPTRYVHTVNEMASISDIDASVTLLAQFLREAHARSYAYSI